MRLLYISNEALMQKTGYGTCIRGHRKILEKLLGSRLTEYMIGAAGTPLETGPVRVFSSKKNRVTEKIRSVLQGLPSYYPPDVCARACEIVREEKITAVYIDNSVSGVLIRALKRQDPKLRVISFFHDIEAVWMREQCRTDAWFRRPAYAAMIRGEMLTVRHGDCNIVLNERDARLFRQVYGKDPEAELPVVLEMDPPERTAEAGGRHIAGTPLQLLFIGAEYGPNLEGLRWFLRQVMPRLEGRAELTIAGLRMEKYREELEGMAPGVTVAGTVEDLEPYYEAADAVIAPISAGGGMKVKTGEALARGKILVSLPEGLEGWIDTVPEGLEGRILFCCKDAEEFRQALESLQGQTFARRQPALTGWMYRTYSADAAAERYRRILQIGEREDE